jgi:hypothetical protein
MGWLQRVAIASAGALLVGLLGTAASLTPSNRGIGTHQQLGLPPCTLVQWAGMRCPSCGMTTSWAHLTRGDVIAAFQANAGGALLAIFSLVCGPWLIVSGGLGRWFVTEPRELTILWVGVLIIAVTLVDWTLRLWN